MDNDDFSCVVDRINSPTLEEFNMLYVQSSRPVIITGGLENWTASSKWNPYYFKSVCGSRTVPVKRMNNGSYLNAPIEMLKFDDYLDRVSSQKPNSEERFYLSEQPIKKILPEIASDFEVPVYVDAKEYLSMCYIGSHVNSQIHFHPYGKALLCVVSGCKRVKLFSPDQTDFLYCKYNFSKIDCDPVDLDKYPLYKKAKYYECEIRAGEMMFFPIYWWHGVQTDEFSSAVVFFWDDSRKVRWNSPSGIPRHYPFLFEVNSFVVKARNRIRQFFGEE
ncbi:cupin-like domain-containing protein [Methylomonas sp. UP202]|uniref:cupin-like domain-containing protein n=1 Tax=Methylomonas sp. UP202 TaxID=3040943 RepID=UPI00247A754A|nr:cupin-like domain-containing protein [Methylomonas sp. UP202]WGS87250.1 cupin-like domain-containing protein [Methylomonas sp. UP202]